MHAEDGPGTVTDGVKRVPVVGKGGAIGGSDLDQLGA